jgi:zinc protease
MSGGPWRTPSFSVSRHTLENGMRVLLMERPHLPILSLTLLVPAGVASESGPEAGLSGFTLGLLPRGTLRRGAVQLAEDVDSLGAVLGVHSDYDFSLAGVSSLARCSAEAIEILAEVAMSPAFEPEEVERRRSDVLSHLERMKDEPGELVRNRFLARIYGEHPYHHPPSGTPETVGRFQAADVHRFYRRFFRPNEAILAVVGDLEAGSTLRMLEDRFGPWAPSEPDLPARPPIPAPSGLTLDPIQKDGMTQATVRMGGLAIRRNSSDYIPLVLANYILGGSGFGSRLMKRLREDAGVTYGAYSNLRPRREPGYFFAGCQTGLETMNTALDMMHDEIRRLHEGGVSPEELDWARRFFTGSLPLSLQTNDQLATKVLEQELFGLEEEFWFKEIDHMQRIEVEEVNRAARRFLDPDLLTVVCLADFRATELKPRFYPGPGPQR